MAFKDICNPPFLSICSLEVHFSSLEVHFLGYRRLQILSSHHAPPTSPPPPTSTLQPLFSVYL